MKKKTLIYIAGGAAVAGLVWWWLSRPKTTVVSPVYRVVSNPQAVAPVAADITAAGNAAAAIINAANSGNAGQVQVPQSLQNISSGSGSDLPSADNPSSVYSLETSPLMAGGIYGSRS